MLTRVLTGVVGIPLVILIMVLGDPVLNIAAAIVALIGVEEYCKMIGKKYRPMRWIALGATLVYFIWAKFFFQNYMIYIATLLIILLIWMVIKYPKYSIVDVGMTLMAPVYVGTLLSFIIAIRNLEYGSFLVWLVFISAWGSDTCAYFAGSCFGKHKLAPVLSPNKTVEGAIGGALGASGIACIYTLIFTEFAFASMRENMWLIVIIVFIGAILSQMGDLAASSIKRTIGEKDFGHLFPGHGGVLDRFDSILLVAPFIFIALIYTIECITI
ncbi:MAG: phosphatidate cytidylyltransferase [Cellulosilyticaceae bacterium]